MGIRVILTDDHKMIRDGLHALLEQESDIEIVAEAGDGATAVKLARELKPNVIVMDIAMPELSGVKATAQVLADNPDVKVIALSMHSDRQNVARMLEAGVAGYLLKDCAYEELVAAIREVVEGQTYFSQKIASVVIEDYVKKLPGGESTPSDTLTVREREVLQLIAEGRNTKEIALNLDLSGKTIETHRRKIMEKLNIYSIAELTKYAIRNGFTSLE